MYSRLIPSRASDSSKTDSSPGMYPTTSLLAVLPPSGRIVRSTSASDPAVSSYTRLSDAELYFPTSTRLASFDTSPAAHDPSFARIRVDSPFAKFHR